MKIRIKNNEIRFRLSKSEQNMLINNEPITTSLKFLDKELCFSLLNEESQSEEFILDFNNSKVSCSINPFIRDELLENPIKGVLLKGETNCFIEIDLRN